MKKVVLLLYMLFAAGFFMLAGDGTQNNPFTVSEAIKKTDGSSTVYWIKGYVVGEMAEYSNNKYFYEMAPPFNGTSAYLIADNKDEIDLSKCMPVQLIDKDNYYLDVNPEKWRKEIMVCGNFRDYFAMPGIKNLTEIQITSAEPMEDETIYWNFYEDMNSKNYVPNSSTNTFAGGIYTGTGDYTNDIKTWKFVGSTLGDTGKDQKWGRAAARIRLTEGSSGSAGYIQMEEDKPNGIGTVRFWAGNYEEDTSGGALALHISSDQGKTWEKASSSQAITRTWKEYQFTIDRQGNLRLRIAKDENGSKGINVDNIRISDYNKTTNNIITSPSETGFDYYTDANGICLNCNTENNTVSVYTLTGQCLHTANYSKGEVTIALNSGIYILQVNNSACKVIVK